MKIRFCGTTLDASGYAEFARYFIYALHKASVEVSVEPILIEPKKGLDFGVKGTLCKTLTTQMKHPDINIINMLPIFFSNAKYFKKGAKNIGFTMWEADKLPGSWVDACNKMDAIFVPCAWNKEVFANSGVTVPIYVVWPGIEPDAIPQDIGKDKLDDKFTFYSIFQWSERKNPEGLLRAYYSEFQGVEDVRLVLKTYRLARLNNNHQLMTENLTQIKKDLNFTHSPEVNLISDIISNEALQGIHGQSHCFVLPHRSEGFGMPHMEAMVHGNPVIATGFSGNVDFMNKENSYPIDYQLTPVHGMQWLARWYDGSMMWAEPDIGHLMKQMRYVYENREEAKLQGLAGRATILEDFNIKTSADMIIKAAEEILGIK